MGLRDLLILCVAAAIVGYFVHAGVAVLIVLIGLALWLFTGDRA